MCGAPVASLDSPSCEHCGAQLATVACPSCFGMIFLGAKFCSHCGAKAERAQVAEATKELCPRCKVDLNAVVVGSTNLRECPRCEGIWVDQASFDQICADIEKQSAVLGMATHLPADPVGQIEPIRYLPCPICAGLMNRVNFAHCSHVIVDVCAKHGTWFDRDELRRIIEFIRAGGMNQARVLEAEQLKSEVARLKESRERLQAGQASGAWEGGSAWGSGGGWSGAKYDAIGIGVSAAVQVLQALFRK